jgi:hypothetical protein
MTKLFRFMTMLVFAAPSVAASECLHYDLPNVQIVGHISRVRVFPHLRPHEATPVPEYAWYFETDRPLCIVAGPKELGNLVVSHTRHFEILPPPKQRDMSKLMGKIVFARGVFIPTQLPHYHTNLTFAAESVGLRHGL